MAITRSALQAVEVVDYRVTAPKTKTIELITSDSLLAQLPESACYVAYSPQGIGIQLQRMPGGVINASAMCVYNDSSSTRLEVLQAEEKTQIQECLEHAETTDIEQRSRDPATGWFWLSIPVLLLVALAFAALKFR